MNIHELQSKMGTKCSQYFCLFKTPERSVIVLDNGFILVASTKKTIQEALQNVTEVHSYNELYQVLRSFYPTEFDSISSELKNDATVKETLAKGYELKYEMALVYRTIYLEMEYYLNGRREVLIDLSIDTNKVKYICGSGVIKYDNQTPHNFLNQFFDGEIEKSLPKNLFLSTPLVIA